MSPSVDAVIQDENRPVLRVEGPVSRWLHVAIDLRAASHLWRVRHVSIGLLKGDVSILEKTPLLRAEWQMEFGAESSTHAQPHWHVLGAAEGYKDMQTFDEVISAERNNFEKYILGEEEESEESDTEAFNHFHYAMVTDWHREPSLGVNHALADASSLLTWIEGCTSYIKHQLEHVDKKAGKF
jgi:hypothetical protein